MEEIKDEPKLLEKTQDELTVGDNLKIAGGVYIVSMAIPFVVMGAFVGAVKLSDKLKQRRLIKELAKNDPED